VVRSDLALLGAGVASNYWLGPDEDFATSVQFGCIATLDSGDLTTLLAPALARQHLISVLTGAPMHDWSKTGTLYRYRFRKNGSIGAIFWRGDGDTGNVDLSGYSSDMYGDAITLSSSYAVTTPVLLFA
jgi:hypothetical protein